MMKRQKKRNILVIIIILILGIFLSQKKKNEDIGYQDDLIFFKLFSFDNKEQESTNAEETIKTENQMNKAKESYKQYIFDVSYKNIDFKEIQMSDTIQKDTLVREKIAPRNKRSI